MAFFSKTIDKLKGALKKTAEVLNTDVRTLFIPGRQIDDAFLDEMEEKLIRADMGVRRVEKTLARRAGMGYFITLHVEADGHMPLRDAHQLGHVVKDRVMADVPSVLDVIVHMEPWS